MADDFLENADTCHHVDGGDNICAYCFRYLGDSTTLDTPLKATGKIKSIWPDLEPLTTLPENLRRRADEINQKGGFLTHRGERRKKVVLFCLYAAAKEMNYPIQPKELIKLLGLKSTDLSSIPSFEMRLAIAMKNNGPKMTTAIQVKTALEILPSMGRRVGLNDDDQLKNLLMISQQLVDDKPELLNWPPTQMAAAMIYYYYVYRFGTEKNINVGVISERTDVSTTEIQKTYNELIK